jgi:hypothetical protein
METVNVSEFRNRIEHLERRIHCDYHSARDGAEKRNWRAVTERVGAELIATVCKRATQDDWDRRERAIDRSTDLISRIF